MAHNKAEEQELQRIRDKQHKFPIVDFKVRCPICNTVFDVTARNTRPPDPKWVNIKGTVWCQCGYEAEILDL